MKRRIEPEPALGREVGLHFHVRDQKAIAKYLRENTHKTIVGSISYAEDGEWKQSATLEAQFRGVKDKNLDQFRSAGKQVILFPDRLKTGDLITPFEAARK